MVFLSVGVLGLKYRVVEFGPAGCPFARYSLPPMLSAAPRGADRAQGRQAHIARQRRHLSEDKTRLETEIAQLKAHIAEIEAARETLPQATPSGWGGAIETLIAAKREGAFLKMTGVDPVLSAAPIAVGI